MNGNSASLSTTAANLFTDTTAYPYVITSAVFMAESATATFLVTLSKGVTITIVLASGQAHPMRCPNGTWITSVTATGTGATGYFNPASFSPKSF